MTKLPLLNEMIKKKKTLWFDQLHIFMFVHESEAKVLKSERNKHISLLTKIHVH